jgi:hypothetical protein
MAGNVRAKGVFSKDFASPETVNGILDTPSTQPNIDYPSPNPSHLDLMSGRVPTMSRVSKRSKTPIQLRTVPVATLAGKRHCTYIPNCEHEIIPILPCSESMRYTTAYRCLWQAYLILVRLTGRQWILFADRCKITQQQQPNASVWYFTD